MNSDKFAFEEVMFLNIRRRQIIKVKFIIITLAFILGKSQYYKSPNICIILNISRKKSHWMDETRH